jgi:hypothetical protein
MAIGLVFQAPGVAQAQYDQMHRELSPTNELEPGQLYHAAGPTENGFCVIEVWESQEALQRFFASKLGPVLQAAQINVPPTIFPVTNIMQP